MFIGYVWIFIVRLVMGEGLFLMVKEWVVGVVLLFVVMIVVCILMI